MMGGILTNFHMTIKYDPHLQNVAANAVRKVLKQWQWLCIVSWGIPNCFKKEYLIDRGFGDVFHALQSLKPTQSKMQICTSYTLREILLY